MTKPKTLAGDFIQVIEGQGDPHELFAWIKENERVLDDLLVRHGALLFRGFSATPEQFRDAATAMGGDEVPYTNGATPRKQHIEGVYLASDFPKKLILPQHHEMSYMRVWPMKVFFYCDIPAAVGGETPLCSTRTFMKRISPRIVEKFSQLGVRYLRNYDGGIVTDWKQAFMTSNRNEVERICQAEHLEPEWRPGDLLRTWGRAQGAAPHPLTGEVLWHNHVVNFAMRCDDPAVMPPIVRMSAPALPPETISDWMSRDHRNLPMNAYYGNGDLIERSVLDELVGVLEAEKVAFPWQKGDFVLLDNMLAFHGRNPYEGDRRILSILRERSDAVARKRAT